MSNLKLSQPGVNGSYKKMHEDRETSREFKWRFRAGNQRITNFETFQFTVLNR